MGNSDGRTSCEFIVSSSHHIHFIMASFNALTTFSLLVLAIIAIALCSGAHAGTGDSGTGDSVKMMLTRRRDAEDFNHHRVNAPSFLKIGAGTGSDATCASSRSPRDVSAVARLGQAIYTNATLARSRAKSNPSMIQYGPRQKLAARGIGGFMTLNESLC